MNQMLKNKIDAHDKNVNLLLKEQKFFIDYFQREYRWQGKHIKLLIEDLSSAFLKSYKSGHQRSEIANYEGYYLGPVVFSVNTELGKKSIIDGQQRITSITLLLIYLNHLQEDRKSKVSIEDLISSELYGTRTFNMSDDSRNECLESLFEKGDYEVKENDSETVRNIMERYYDIENSFPEELMGDALLYFIDWFKMNVIFVEIIAYSDDNAYRIFETMNDRGLNLSHSEMLKGYVLSKIESKKRNEINDLWKREIQKLHLFDENADQTFFHAWFRSKYAITMRQGQDGEKDFEIIGGRFHNWFKDNHRELLQIDSPDEFYSFFKIQFPFFVDCFIKIKKAQENYDSNMPFVHYITYWGIADSLQFPLLLAPIDIKDDKNIIERKINNVARYIETFTVLRSSNYRKFGQTTIKYSMFNVMKLIRNTKLNSLNAKLSGLIDKIPEIWDEIPNLGLHGQNRKFIKHLLSRITSFIDNEIGKSTTYVTYHHPNGKQFEIEHIWADKFNQHKDEFVQENEFKKWRNSIGAMILLPQGTNQSFNSDVYEDKLDHYLKENIYAQTLHEDCYKKNPNFTKSEVIKDLKFKNHPHFKKKDIIERQKLVQRICEKIWSVECFKE